MFAMAAIAILGTMALALTRALRGPTVYDRILGVNSLGTTTVLIIAILGFLTERPEFLDLSLVYALISYVGVIAALKFFEYSHLGIASRQKAEKETPWRS